MSKRRSNKNQNKGTRQEGQRDRQTNVPSRTTRHQQQPKQLSRKDKRATERLVDKFRDTLFSQGATQYASEDTRFVMKFGAGVKGLDIFFDIITTGSAPYVRVEVEHRTINSSVLKSLGVNPVYGEDVFSLTNPGSVTHFCSAVFEALNEFPLGVNKPPKGSHKAKVIKSKVKPVATYHHSRTIKESERTRFHEYEMTDAAVKARVSGEADRYPDYEDNLTLEDLLEINQLKGKRSTWEDRRARWEAETTPPDSVGIEVYDRGPSDYVEAKIFNIEITCYELPLDISRSAVLEDITAVLEKHSMLANLSDFPLEMEMTSWFTHIISRKEAPFPKIRIKPGPSSVADLFNSQMSKVNDSLEGDDILYIKDATTEEIRQRLMRNP